MMIDLRKPSGDDVTTPCKGPLAYAQMEIFPPVSAVNLARYLAQVHVELMNNFVARLHVR